LKNEIAERRTCDSAGAKGHSLFAQSRASGWRKQGVVFGFTVAEWQKLADALLRLARENEVVESEMTQHGRRFVVDGRLTAPDGTSLNVRSAWYIDVAGGAPRFVTAHPLPKL
jgi:hypothetical protein